MLDDIKECKKKTKVDFSHDMQNPLPASVVPETDPCGFLRKLRVYLHAIQRNSILFYMGTDTPNSHANLLSSLASII